MEVKQKNFKPCRIMNFNSLLKKQIEKHLGDTDSLPPKWKAFLESINDDFTKQCEDFFTLEQSLDKTMSKLEKFNEKIKTNQKAIEQMAFYDSLTNLPNRNLLKDRFEVMLAQASRLNKKVAVFYMDLDHFKNLNDSQGHQAGDQFLVEVGQFIKSVIRKGDTVGRLGGDEFVILLGNIDHEEEAIKLAQKLNLKMKAPFDINGREVYSGFSIGIAFYPNDGTDMKTVFENADIAMYQAKKRGRNTFQLFTSSMNEKIIQKVNLKQDIQRAIEKDEFELHYQPQIDLAKGNITGIEALLRWRLPDGKLLFPDKFIPVAEESGLILDLGEWVLNAACRQIKSWNKLPNPMPPLAINLSTLQFKQFNLVKNIAKTIEQYGIDPSVFELEITETALMVDTSITIKNLNALREMGFRLSLDDFGTGFSSLNYLTKLPVQTLKIDKTFISDYKDKRNHAIILALITLCKDLELTTIAEGVETEEQRDFLFKSGCDQYQGYLFSRPLPAEEIANLIWPKICRESNNIE
jgi:polar amino acid transport system substrate-binding protein